MIGREEKRFFPAASRPAIKNPEPFWLFSQSALALPPPQSRDRDRHPAPGAARAGLEPASSAGPRPHQSALPRPLPVPGPARTRARARLSFFRFFPPTCFACPTLSFSISGPIPAESSVIRQLPPLLQGGARSRLFECLSIKTSYRWQGTSFFPPPRFVSQYAGPPVRAYPPTGGTVCHTGSQASCRTRRRSHGGRASSCSPPAALKAPRARCPGAQGPRRSEAGYAPLRPRTPQARPFWIHTLNTSPICTPPIYGIGAHSRNILSPTMVNSLFTQSSVNVIHQ